MDHKIVVSHSCSDNGIKVETREVAATGHKYDEETIKEATCTEAGLEKRTCWNFGCNYEETREIPATGEHLWSDWEIVSEPTDTEPGKQVRTCSSCGLQEEREIHF